MNATFNINIHERDYKKAVGAAARYGKTLDDVISDFMKSLEEDEESIQDWCKTIAKENFLRYLSKCGRLELISGLINEKIPACTELLQTGYVNNDVDLIKSSLEKLDAMWLVVREEFQSYQKLGKAGSWEDEVLLIKERRI